MLSYNQDYYQKHKDKLIDDAKAYYEKNKERRKLVSHDYYMRNRARIIARQKEWEKNNRGKVRAHNKRRRRRIKKEIFELLGNKCANPFNLNHGDFLIDWRCFVIDHINGHGNEERRKFGTHTDDYFKHILGELRNGSKDYQLLCSNCNWIKRHTNNEHC